MPQVREDVEAAARVASRGMPMPARRSEGPDSLPRPAIDPSRVRGCTGFCIQGDSRIPKLLSEAKSPEVA
jgi:hypothetical protein